MPEQIPADVRLHPDAEGMPVVGHNKLQQRAQHIRHQYKHHHRKEGAVQLIGQHIVQSAACNQGKGQINGRDTHGAGHVQGKQPPVWLKVAQKNTQRFAPLKIFGRQKNHLFPLLYIFFCRLQVLTYPRGPNYDILSEYKFSRTTISHKASLC